MGGWGLEGGVVVCAQAFESRNVFTHCPEVCGRAAGVSSLSPPHTKAPTHPKGLLVSHVPARGAVVNKGQYEWTPFSAWKYLKLLVGDLPPPTEEAARPASSEGWAASIRAAAKIMLGVRVVWRMPKGYGHVFWGRHGPQAHHSRRQDTKTSKLSPPFHPFSLSLGPPWVASHTHPDHKGRWEIGAVGAP